MDSSDTPSPQAAVVTGAGRGIGRALALELASMGYPVAIQSRTHSQLYDTRAAIEALGGRARVVPGDVTQSSSANELIDRCSKELGHVAVAVACAGQAYSVPLLKTTAKQVRELLDVNFMSSLYLVQAAAKAMIESGTRGRIIVIASTAAVKGMRYTAAYAASKHAVLGLVRSAALELAPYGITVNALCPGWVATPMLDDVKRTIASKTGCTEVDALAKIESMIPMGRVLQPDEVAGALRFVVSDAASNYTGQALLVDGGETIQ